MTLTTAASKASSRAARISSTSSSPTSLPHSSSESSWWFPAFSIISTLTILPIAGLIVTTNCSVSSLGPSLKLETPFNSDSLYVSGIDVVSFPECSALPNAQQNRLPLKASAGRKAALNVADLLSLRPTEQSAEKPTRGLCLKDSAKVRHGKRKSSCRLVLT